MYKRYDELKKDSDKSIPEAKKIISKFLFTNIQPTSWIDDVTKCIDLVFDAKKVVFAHRCRRDDGFPIGDITIKTQCKGICYVPVEFNKLCDYEITDELNLYYFYCQYNYTTNKISRYVIFDLKKLISYPEFKERKMFRCKEDATNTWDGGSKFNKIALDTLRKYNCLIVDESKKGLKIY